MLTNNYVKTKAKNERLLACLETYNLISNPVLTKIKADYAYAQKAFMGLDELLILTEKNLTHELLTAVRESVKPLNLLKRLQHKLTVHLFLLKTV